MTRVMHSNCCTASWYRVVDASRFAKNHHLTELHDVDYDPELWIARFCEWFLNSKLPAIRLVHSRNLPFCRYRSYSLKNVDSRTLHNYAKRSFLQPDRHCGVYIEISKIHRIHIGLYYGFYIFWKICIHTRNIMPVRFPDLLGHWKSPDTRALGWEI